MLQARLADGRAKEAEQKLQGPLILSRRKRSYLVYPISVPYLCTKNEAMAPLHVATLTVQRELPKYEIIFSI